MKTVDPAKSVKTPAAKPSTTKVKAAKAKSPSPETSSQTLSTDSKSESQSESDSDSDSDSESSSSAESSDEDEKAKPPQKKVVEKKASKKSKGSDSSSSSSDSSSSSSSSESESDSDSESSSESSSGESKKPAPKTSKAPTTQPAKSDVAKEEVSVAKKRRTNEDGASVPTAMHSNERDPATNETAPQNGREKGKNGNGKPPRKTNTPFQRIKPGTVSFADARLKDNSFESRVVSVHRRGAFFFTMPSG